MSEYYNERYGPKQKAWTTKYLFTKGIVEVEGWLTDDEYPSLIVPWRHKNGMIDYAWIPAYDFRLTEKKALELAKKKASKRVASLRKQLKKIEDVRRELRRASK